MAGPWTALLRSWKNLDVREAGRQLPALLVALAATILIITQIWDPKFLTSDDFLRLTAALILWISLLLLPDLVFEDRSKKRIAVGILVALFVVFLLATRHLSSMAMAFKIAYAFVLFHLLASLTPAMKQWLSKNKTEPVDRELSFWSENWLLINRLHMAGTQCILLFLGTATALFSVNYLLGIEVSSELYGSFAIFYLVFVSVFLFISSLGDRSALTEPTVILRRLVRNVFTPLALMYFLILYSYAIKIAILREWPRGGLAYLVAGLALIVTLSYVIMRPLATSNEFGSFLRRFWGLSFRLLIPPVVLLLLGLARRVSEYGWTEARVTLGYLGLWMIGISIYYWNPSRRSIAGIPLSLSVLLLVTWFGPLSPGFISRVSQTSRLEAIFSDPERVKALTLNEVKKASDSIEHVCDLYGPIKMAKALGIDSEKLPLMRKTEAGASPERRGFLSSGLSSACETYSEPGAVSVARDITGLSAIAQKEQDSSGAARSQSSRLHNRAIKNYFEFENVALAEFSFRDDGPAKEAFFQTVGKITFRWVDNPRRLEWSPEKDVWINVDLKDLVKDINSDKRRWIMKHGNRRIEIQFTQVGHLEDQPNSLTLVTFFVVEAQKVQNRK